MFIPVLMLGLGNYTLNTIDYQFYINYKPLKIIRKRKEKEENRIINIDTKIYDSKKN